MPDEARSLANQADSLYLRAIELHQEDSNARALHYLLLRLTVGGLKREEVPTLKELARLAFLEADISKQADQIKQQATSSPLAIAIASVVAQARGSKRTAMLGAVLGAHAALATRGSVTNGVAEINGAILGAAVLQARDLTVQFLEQPMWSDFVSRD
jgi:hypothetical protein